MRAAGVRLPVDLDRDRHSFTGALNSARRRPFTAEGDDPGMTWGGRKEQVRAAAMASLLLLGGCAATVDEPTSEGDVVVGTATDPLTVGAVKWLNGTYAGCIDRTGAWSARVSGSATMDNPALSVTRNDTACKLSLTGLVADQAYTAVAPMLLGAAYPGAPTTFVSAGGTMLGNARLESVTFASDFQLTFVHAGDDPPVTPLTVSGGYATVSSSSATTGVLPPTYTLDVNGLRFTADPVQLVVGITGYAILNDGLLTGSTYVIDTMLGATPTYGQTAAAFAAAAPTQKSISSVNQQIPASEFGIVTLSLLGSTQVRNVIVRRTVLGSHAYQILRVTFYS